MATLFSIADEVAVSLGFTHDDARQNRTTLSYYVKIAVDKLNDRRLTKDYSGDQRSSASNIETFVVDVVHQVAPFTPSGDAGAADECLFFEPPANLLNLPFDGGLVWVRYHRPTLPLNCPPSIAGANFGITTLGSLSTLYGQAYQRPNESRPLVARDRYRCYVYGCSPLIKKLRIGLLCALPDMRDIDPNAPLQIPDEYLMDVRKLVLDSAKFSLLVPERLRNDGRGLEPGEQVRTEKQVSVNDPINIVGE